MEFLGPQFFTLTIDHHQTIDVKNVEIKIKNVKKRKKT